MSGQKQKRPYKRREAPILSGHDKAEQIGQVTSTNEGEGSAQADISPVFIQSLKTETRTEQGRETLDISAVYRVEAAVGRTSNAWGMVDPLELIRAVDRVLRG